MENKFKICFVVAVILLLVACFMGNGYRQERDMYKNKLENDFQQKYIKLEQQLRDSERYRMVLGDSINSRDIYIQSLVKLNQDYDKQLKDVKGRYNKLTSNEKALELTRRARQ